MSDNSLAIDTIARLQHNKKYLSHADSFISELSTSQRNALIVVLQDGGESLIRALGMKVEIKCPRCQEADRIRQHAVNGTTAMLFR